MSRKRKYHSELRNFQAEATKERILNAAKKLFSSQGFEQTTLTSIATLAEVSAPTIYLLFKSKEGILSELMHAVFFGPPYQSVVENVRKQNDPREILRGAARIARTIHDAEKSEMGFIRGAAAFSPALKRLEKDAERIRFERQDPLLQRLEKKKAFRRGMDIKRGKDILWTLTSREIYRMFVIERGWTSDDYESWLAMTLSETLIA